MRMERGILVGASLALLAVALVGCGGGGDAGGGGNQTTPAPGAPTPAPGPGPCPSSALPMTAVSYNLFWWCMSGRDNSPGKSCPQNSNNKGFNQLFAKMKTFEPYDLIGLQECGMGGDPQSAQQIGDGIGYGTSHEWHHGPADIAQGWNKAKFDKLGDYQQKVIGKDQYGDRYLMWVRLQFKGSKATVFFANTHGPLPGPFGNCGSNFAENYIKTVKDNIQPGDAFVTTGDFNCLPGNPEIDLLNATWTLAANDKTTHFDHIYVDSKTTCVNSWDSHNGAPSDHSILWAHLSAKVPSSELVV